MVLLAPAPDPLEARIRERFPEIELAVCRTYSELGPTVARAKPEVALAFKTGPERFPREAVIEAASVKWVQATGAGIDHWMPWDPDRVTLTNASGIHADVMSQYTAWAILNHQLGLPGYARRQAAREWRKVPHEPATGKTLVVVGFGRIGRTVGRLAKTMGMRVIGVRAHPEPSGAADRVVGLDRLMDVLGEADYVSVILPRTRRTEGLIDAKVFAAMKKGAYFINTGRGGIVDEEALLRALRSGHLAGATVDVFATEPLPADSPFWDLDNVIVLPHATGDAADWPRRVGELFCDNMDRYLAGAPLQNVVDPAQGY